MRLLKSSSGSAETFSQPVLSARSALIWSAAAQDPVIYYQVLADALERRD